MRLSLGKSWTHLNIVDAILQKETNRFAKEVCKYNLHAQVQEVLSVGSNFGKFFFVDDRKEDPSNSIGPPAKHH